MSGKKTQSTEMIFFPDRFSSGSHNDQDVFGYYKFAF